MASSALQATRSLLRRTDHCIFVFYHEPTGQWFALANDPSCRMLVPITFSNSSPLDLGAVVAVDSDIYVIGGPTNDLRSSSVWVLDCRFHTWRQAPCVRVARRYAEACVIDGKICVVGGCERRSVYWAEVFDPKMQIWEPLLSPDFEESDLLVSRTTVFERKVYVNTMRNRKMVYEPEKGIWDVMEKSFGSEWGGGETCVIDNVLYSYNYRGLKWYDSKENVWRHVKGLEGLRKFHLFRIANYGGKLAFLSTIFQPKRIWYGEIALERFSREEIWGTVECSDVVFTPPKMDRFHNYVVVLVSV